LQVVMMHDFEFEWPHGDSLNGGAARAPEKHTSSLLAFGSESNGTAMAQTVGLTAAIGTELVLDGALDQHTGLASPLLPAVYLPSLEKLAQAGYVFRESAEPLHESRALRR
jgi:hypothetical protein